MHNSLTICGPAKVLGVVVRVVVGLETWRWVGWHSQALDVLALADRLARGGRKTRGLEFTHYLTLICTK